MNPATRCFVVILSTEEMRARDAATEAQREQFHNVRRRFAEPPGPILAGYLARTKRERRQAVRRCLAANERRDQAYVASTLPLLLP